MDAIVVGCGASGVAALTRLMDAGLKVLGLEAAGRVGGRICTENFADNVVDLGAAWCHGEVDNIVFEMANPHGLLGKSSPYHTEYVMSNGELVPKNIAEEMSETVRSIVDGAEKDSRSISDCLRTGFIEWYERNNHVGGQTDPLLGKSMRGLAESWTCSGDFMQHWKGKGFTTILDLMLKSIPKSRLETFILLNKEVEGIRWRASQPGSAETPLVHITCKDGSLYAARRVIVTVSIGVLKERHKQLFNPPLPQAKINTINNLQLCVLDKIYIEFEEAWWTEFHAIFSILWRQEEKEKFTREEQWLTEVYGFMTIDNQPKVLLAWIYGEGAKTMEEISLENVQIGIEKLLNMLFENKFNLTPIKSIIRTQWASNPLIRGAYSYRSVATEKDGGSAEILSQPLCAEAGLPVVCFGGEATSYHRHGAVHGAIEAGHREANRVINSFNL